MDLGPLNVTIRFPEPAGTHQARGATASLVAELGDNYAKYHAFLARELEATGGRPEPEGYGTDFLGFYRDSDRWADIVIAEILLRRCRGARRHGRALGHVDPNEPNPLNERHQLVSVESGEPSSAPLATGSARPHHWTRPPSPPER